MLCTNLLLKITAALLVFLFKSKGANCVVIHSDKQVNSIPNFYYNSLKKVGFINSNSKSCCVGLTRLPGAHPLPGAQINIVTLVPLKKAGAQLFVIIECDQKWPCFKH